jgi:hypothetical protein
VVLGLNRTGQSSPGGVDIALDSVDGDFQAGSFQRVQNLRVRHIQVEEECGDEGDARVKPERVAHFA